MPTFDVNAAKAAGYSDQEIQDFITQSGAQPQYKTGRLMQGGAYAADTATPEWQAKYGPLSGLSDLQKVEVGAGRGLMHTARSAGNLVGLVPNSTLEEEAHVDAPLMADPSGRFGNLAGEALATAPLGEGAVGLASKLAPNLASSLIAGGALRGGVQGLTTSDPGQRVANTTLGALTGGGLGTGATAAQKLAYGLTQTPSAQFLRSRGVTGLTLGQMNPTGAANQFEQMAEHIPGVDALVEGARGNAEHQYQRAIFEAASAPGTKITPSANPSDMLQQAYDSYAPLYDAARGHPIDPGDVSALRAGLSTASAVPGTTKAGQKAGQSFVDNELTRLPANPTSSDLLDLRSNIRQAARKAKLSTDSVAQDKAAVYDNAEGQVTQALRLNLPPQAQSALDLADSNYGNYKIVENAVAQSKDNLAGLTPAKLSQAIYNATADPAYAKGAGGDLRDLAKAGTETFQASVPVNGSLVMPLASTLTAAHFAPIPTAIGAGGVALGSLTDTGRSLAAGATAPQQAVQRLAGALRGSVPQPLQAPAAAIGGRLATGAAMPYTPQLISPVTAAVLGALGPPGAVESH